MLYDKLKNYSKSGIYPFHMPGHKRTDITEEGIIPVSYTHLDVYKRQVLLLNHSGKN